VRRSLLGAPSRRLESPAPTDGNIEAALLAGGWLLAPLYAARLVGLMAIRDLVLIANLLVMWRSPSTKVTSPNPT